MFLANISGIGAEIFPAFPFRRGINNPSIQNFGQPGDVMPVSPGHDDGERDATLFDQEMPL